VRIVPLRCLVFYVRYVYRYASRFSSGALSMSKYPCGFANPSAANVCVIAAVNVVLPWSMCPMVLHLRAASSSQTSLSPLLFTPPQFSLDSMMVSAILDGTSS